MCRILMLTSLVWVGWLAGAPAVFPGGYTTPVAGEVVWAEQPVRTRLRKQQVLLLGVRAGQPLGFTIYAYQVGRYTDNIEYSLLNSEGASLRSGRVAPGAEVIERVTDIDPGVYRLEIDTRGNAAEVMPYGDAASFVASKDHPLGIVYHAPALYFWVPEGAEAFQVQLRGQGEREHVAFAVYDAAGEQVARSDTLTEGGVVAIAVPKDSSGAWRVELEKLPDYTFEDVSLAISGDVPGVVAEAPAALLQPLISPFARFDGETARLGVRLFAAPEQLAGCRLQVVATNLETGERIFTGTQTQFPPMEVSGTLKTPGFVHCRLDAVLQAPAGEVLAREEKTLGIAHGELFIEKPYADDHLPAPVTMAEQQAGFQVFVRDEPGNLRPTALPAAEEIATRVRRRVAMGEFETLFVGLYPLRNLPEVTVEIEPFVNAQGTRLGADVGVRWVRCWPQRTDWRAKTFHVIPELLEQRSTGTLRTKRTQPLAFPFRVPPNAEPGVYHADVMVRPQRRPAVKALTLEVEVLPFELVQPQGIVWGLYPDSRRWDNMPESQIEAEMVDFHEHGMTALMLYPQWTADWAWDNGTLTADFTAFRTRMRLYRKVGLGGPMVISLQSADHMLRQLTGAKELTDPAVTDAYRQMLALIRQEAADEQWPEHALHSVDEPHSGDKVAAALRTLRMIKEAGFDTFNTCYGKTVREVLDPYLDVRCYNNIGFLSFPSEQAARQLRDETLEAGDVFWWYGTGCYTNRSFIQDGNIIANRFMAGIHFWRTGATGCWSWTFLRPKGDAYDDFDGQSAREYKDACIAYPTPDGSALVSTLQWEGLREGVDDYKVLATLTDRIRHLQEQGTAAQKAAAEEVQQEVETRMAALPWTCREGAFTNADAQALRDQLIDMILRLDPVEQ